MNKLTVITKALDDLNLTDIVIYDMREKSPFFEYFLISTASNNRQLNASLKNLKDALAKEKMDYKSIEGSSDSNWVLMDAHDIVVNIFTTQDREYYNIEKMLLDIDTIDVETVLK